MEAYDNRGVPYADGNDVNFRQGLLRLSDNPDIRAELDRFRFKELADAFLDKDTEPEWVDNYFQCLQSYIEINVSIKRFLSKELKKKNRFRKENGIPLIDIEKQLLKVSALDYTIQRMYSKAKNLCQLSKSRDGIGVRTATSQRLISLTREENSSNEIVKKDLFGRPSQSVEEKEYRTDFGGNKKW